MNIHDATLPEAERLISEQFRLVAKQYVELDKAASLLEEMKTTVLAQRMKALGDMPVAHAEREVKADPSWEEYITQMVDTRSKANLKRYQLEFLRMKFTEAQSHEANARHEARLSR